MGGDVGASAGGKAGGNPGCPKAGAGVGAIVSGTAGGAKAGAGLGAEVGAPVSSCSPRKPVGGKGARNNRFRGSNNVTGISKARAQSDAVVGATAREGLAAAMVLAAEQV